jgi:leucyl-tRNA synthetase
MDQWIFLKFYEKGLAYKAEFPINFARAAMSASQTKRWGRRCERCGGEVFRMVPPSGCSRSRHTPAADDDLDTVDYLEKFKARQINWFGRRRARSSTPARRAGRTLTSSPRVGHALRPKYMVVSPSIRSSSSTLPHPPTSTRCAPIRRRRRQSDFERSELSRTRPACRWKASLR